MPMRMMTFLETLGQDVRYGVRLLWRNPTFAIVAILTLAMGTGANTAIFQLVDAVALRTLPVSDPEKLVEIKIVKTAHGRTGQFNGRRPNLSNPLWERIRAEQQAFSDVLAWGSRTINLAAGGEVRPAEGLWVSGSFFSALGVGAAAGRVFTDADDRRGCADPGAVISNAFWHREYGGDPAAVGRSLLLDGRKFDIVGVTAPGFFGVDVGRSFDIALPICAEPMIRARSALDQPDTWFLAAFGRLKPGWTIAQANAHLEAISPAIFQVTLPPRYNGQDASDYLKFQLGALRAATGVSSLRAAYSDPLWILLGVTGLVVLIACANVANLMLARATARQREIAVRLAIGASRRRIVRQMLSESLLIAVCGVLGGAVLAQWFSQTLVGFLTTTSERLFVDLSPDWRILLFTVALAVTACLLFGLAPAMRGTAVARGASSGSAHLRDRATTDRGGLRRALVVIQVALSLVLVVGALLFVRSLRNLTTLDPGFRQEGVMTVDFNLQRAQIPEANRQAVYDQIVDRIRAVPGVATAARAFTTPVSGNFWNDRILVDGKPQPEMSNFNTVGPEYFATIGTPLVAGREFDRRDTRNAPPVAIVNESFARKYFAGRHALGQTFQIEAPAGAPRPAYQIVGLVKDTKYTDLREAFGPIAYLAVSQDQQPSEWFQVVLRASTAMPPITQAISRIAAEVHPSVTLQVQTMEGQVRESLMRERLMATLSAFFGVLAVTIAAIGLYGVMSYMVARRKVEIGIRMALGADARSVTRMVVGEAGALLAGGLIVGAAIAVVAARSAAALLYGLTPWDPATLVLAIAGLSSVALAASWIPARRAARVDPTVALREQ